MSVQQIRKGLIKHVSKPQGGKMNLKTSRTASKSKNYRSYILKAKVYIAFVTWKLYF